ncbi:UDP-N-acetyl-D-mannosamine dehydrogenase [Shewanella aestuarii]|uniref:UDP-N-acetyl-D-mannosamine dehydrogenase n=1 Tax=Shewanella aestuarii TaxID=1028752 RepID=A0A6G9QL26_9GAMM|nr:UDP-N-acetyl-D-mannosamine dehydrogenase [Shewanella aestuarii]QIR15098.1 UDP-N-acetyl-D-mannosamine dehydrogenase [Shewanella aestuarii]
MSFKTVSVIGLGYIGLPTAAMFASRKVNVIGVDVNQHAVNTINQGKIHIIEPELDAIVFKAVQDGYLTASLEAKPADAFLVAVPTPFKEEHQPDLTYIKSACESIGPVLQKGNLVILESTSPVGATELMAEWLAELRPDLSFPQQAGESCDINIAHCPERVLPGHVVRELVANDRVIGGLTDKCSQRSVELYKIFVEGDCIVTNARTAEMAKLTENSSRDVSIAFANELSLICDELDINVWELISLANRHPRVNILQPGPGVGGHCIAVDPWFIVSKTPDVARLIRTAREVNDSKPLWVIEKVKKLMGEFLINNPSKSAADLTVACFGLAFKPNIDDLRESPALFITETLANTLPSKVIAVEPNVESFTSKKAPALTLSTMEDALNADILVMLVDHDEFKTIHTDKLNHNLVIDTKGIWG